MKFKVFSLILYCCKPDDYKSAKYKLFLPTSDSNLQSQDTQRRNSGGRRVAPSQKVEDGVNNIFSSNIDFFSCVLN